MKTPLVLIGGGGHAKVVAAVVERIGRFRIVGYAALAAAPAWPDAPPYLGDDSVLPDLVASGRVSEAALAIGIVDVDSNRVALQRNLRASGLAMPVIVSPMAIVNRDVTIGDGTVVMDGVIINPGVRIGECSILNTSATIEHDCTVGSFCHVAPGAVLCGGSSVGVYSVVGANACVLPGVRIGERCLVGAGAVVTHDLVEPGVYVGNPAARVVK